MALSPDTKDRLGIVVDAARFVFQWGFIPTVIYLGFKKGPEPGQPPLSLLGLLWQ